MDVLPPYGSLTTINEKTDFLRTDGGNFYALYESLTTTHEKMYLLRKRSLYFSQLRDSIAPGSILMASYVFFPQKHPMSLSLEWRYRAVPRASYMFSHRNRRCPSHRSGASVPVLRRVMFYFHRTSWCLYHRGGAAQVGRNYLYCLYLRGQIKY